MRGDDEPGGRRAVRDGRRGLGIASDGAARIIPASAFFEMPENMRRERRPAEGSAAVPALCDRELAAGDGVVASAAMMNLYQQP